LGKFDPDFQLHNAQAIEASKRLYTVVIPNFAAQIETLSFPHGSQQLISQLHLAGINIRQLGFVRRLIKSDKIRSLILTEMAARIMKEDVRPVSFYFNFL